jgi:dipeptidyl aminopeptidase/acylaminoacyl peptidase
LQEPVSALAHSLALVAATVAGIGLFRGVLRWGIRASLAAPRMAHDRTPADCGLPFETVRIDTANGRGLHGWLIPPVTGTALPWPTVIVLHGWGGNAATMLPLARPLCEAGFASLFVDARCHGASDDDSFASLPRFAEDVEHAMRWLTRRAEIDARHIGLIGHSVGAGAVLLVASRRPDVAAVVSVAAFSHPAAMMRRWLSQKRIPERPLGRYVLGYVQDTIGHRFDDIAPVATIARVTCPVLLVHGADDEVVPLGEAQQIFAARSHERVELLVLGGDHDSFADLERHLERLTDFLRRAMAPPLPPSRAWRPGAGDRSPHAPAPSDARAAP